MSLGLSDSMSTMTARQFGELVHYDMMVSFADDTAYSTVANANGIVGEDDDFALTTIVHTEAVEVHAEAMVMRRTPKWWCR